jgi:RNA polymerase sigma-70 factor (ECF subfamily)
MQPVTVKVTEIIAPNEARDLRAARGGDPAAFEALVATRLAGAFRLAAAILGRDADAADAVQNALVAAWRELPRLRELDRFDAWFHRILVNECRMQLRRSSRSREVYEGAGSTSPWDGIDDLAQTSSLERIELLDLLEGAFQTLDADDRALVVMHHLEGRPLAEIAAAVHMPVGTVKWRLHEARQTLQRALEAVG